MVRVGEGQEMPSRTSQPTDFDALWREAESLMPEGDVLEEVTRWFPGDGGGFTAAHWSHPDDQIVTRGFGDTPTRAVQDLVAILRKGPPYPDPWRKRGR
jgi:hypothetical protein